MPNAGNFSHPVISGTIDIIRINQKQVPSSSYCFPCHRKTKNTLQLFPSFFFGTEQWCTFTHTKKCLFIFQHIMSNMAGQVVVDI